MAYRSPRREPPIILVRLCGLLLSRELTPANRLFTLFGVAKYEPFTDCSHCPKLPCRGQKQSSPSARRTRHIQLHPILTSEKSQRDTINCHPNEWKPSLSQDASYLEFHQLFACLHSPTVFDRKVWKDQSQSDQVILSGTIGVVS